MLVKVGDRIIDPSNEAVMLILSEQDKKNISNMAEGATKLCMYPDHRMMPHEVDRFMMLPDAPEGCQLKVEEPEPKTIQTPSKVR